MRGSVPGRMGPEAAEGPARAAGERVERTVRARLAPSEELLARVATTRERLVGRAAEIATARSLPLVRAVVAGSAARGTFLADRLDIDLFLLFPPELPRADLERHGLALAQELLQATETRYAEHPYLRGTFDGFSVDAVPGYAVTDPSAPQSAVDRTPFHDAYLQRQQTPAMVEEVRLTKQFLRAQGVYGSEARTQGLSGYAVELLVLKFGSLDALLAAARGWRRPVRVTFAPTSAPRVPEGMPLVMDDPVDPHRNVTSALSVRNFATLVLAAEAYLADPSEEFFRPRTRPRFSRAEGLARASARGTHVAGLRLPRPKAVDDILYPQLAKAARSVEEEALRLGFRVLGSAYAAGRSTVTVLLECEPARLVPAWVHAGPPVGVGRADAFLAKWTAPGAGVLQGPYVAEDGRLQVEVERKVREVEPLLTGLLGQISLGRDVGRHLPEGTRFVPLAELPDDEEVAEALGELYGKSLPWRRP